MSPRERVDITHAPANDPEPALGPSDSSDSANDMPPGWKDHDTDRGGTGARPGVDVGPDELDSLDIRPDAITDAEDAGVTDDPDPLD